MVLNSKDTVNSVKFMVDFWKEAFDEGGLAWDDTSNNRAFLSGTICATLNGASIYLLAKSKPDTFLDEKGKPMFEDMAHSPLPKGRGGQFGYHLPMTNMLMGIRRTRKRRRISSAGSPRRTSTAAGSTRSRAIRWARLPFGRMTRCGRRIR